MGNVLIQPSDYLDALPRMATSFGEDNFIDTFQYHAEITDLVSSKLKHSWNLFIQQSTTASITYQEFIRRGDWISKSNSHLNTLPVSLSGLRSLAFHTEGKSSSLEDLEEKKTQGTTEGKVSSQTPQSQANASHQKQAIIDHCFTGVETQPWLHTIVFPLFLQSEDYRNYVASCLEDNEANEFLYQGEKQTLESLTIIFDQQTNRVKDTLASGLSIIDYSEWKRLSFHEYWLFQLVSFSEEFPFPISLATARFDRRGFPLVYVNKAFERMTLYERKEVIGKNCKLLQSHESENEKILKMSEALRYARAVKVVVTNQRKIGESFTNVVAMKPIFDQNGIYSYVICIHAEVTNYESIPYNISPLDDFLAIIPNVISTNYY